MMERGWGRRIAKARDLIDQGIFAAQLGIGKTALGDYENERTLPRIDVIEKVYRLTGVTPDEVVLGPEAPINTGTALNFDILQAVLEAVEIENHDDGAAVKAKLAVALYRDRIKNMAKVDQKSEAEVRNVRRRKRVQGNPGHGQGG